MCATGTQLLYITLNKIHYTHVSCHGFIHVEHKELGYFLITDSTIDITTTPNCVLSGNKIDCTFIKQLSQEAIVRSITI
jgi:hypothetical protein